MRKSLFTIALLAMAFIVVGCAITDYSGIVDHKTTAEAKLFGKDVAFSGFGDDFDGTYAYTVKYDNRGGQGTVTIISYRNEVVSSFNRDGVVDRDGDDVQGGSGTLGGRFLTRFVAVDNDVNNCGFGDNVTQDKSALGAGAFLCITGAVEEIDADFDLQAAFSSLDDLLGQIWNRTLTGEFTLDVNGLIINGTTFPIGTFSIGATAGPNRPIYLTINNQPGTASLVQTLLDNTNHLEPVALGLTFAGGMRINPGGLAVAFDHDKLMGLL